MDQMYFDGAEKSEPKVLDNSGRLIKKYIDKKRADGLRKSTLEYYQNTIIDAVSAMGGDIQQIGAEDVQKLLTEWHRSYAPGTVMNNCDILSGFSSWLKTEGHITDSPICDIRAAERAYRVQEKAEKAAVKADKVQELFKNSVRVIENFYTDACTDYRKSPGDYSRGRLDLMVEIIKRISEIREAG